MINTVSGAPGELEQIVAHVDELNTGIQSKLSQWDSQVMSLTYGHLDKTWFELPA